MPRGILHRVWRRIQSLRLARDIKASGLFEPDTYLANNPDIGRTDPLKHWVFYGRFEGRTLNFSALSEWLLPHIIAGDLEASAARELSRHQDDLERLKKLSARYGLTLEDYTYYRTLKNGEFDKTYDCLSSVSKPVHFKGAFYFASRLMRLGELEKAHDWGRSLTKPDVDTLRQCLDMARALGRPVTQDVEKLIAALPEEPHPLDAQLFKARLPVLEGSEKSIASQLRDAGLESVNGSMPGRVGEFARECEPYSSLINAATYNGVFSAPLCVSRTQAGRDQIISLADARDRGFECVKVRLLMPYYWVHPQNTHRVTGAVLRLHRALIEEVLNAGKWIVPIFATPIFDITHEDNYGLETLSYHTVTTAAPRNAYTHYKESYLPGYFSHDPSGFSGWSSLADQDISYFEHDDPAARVFHEGLFARFVKGNISKYNQEGSGADESPGKPFIFAALQVPDDSVSRWAYRPVREWLSDVCWFGNAQNIPVVIKRHPLDKSLGTAETVAHCQSEYGAIVSQAPIHTLIAASCVVVTVNSGVGFEALIHEKPVITCGKTDYGAASAIAKDEKALKQALENAMADKHPVTRDQMRQFLATFLQQHCYKEDCEG